MDKMTLIVMQIVGNGQLRKMIELELNRSLWCIYNSIYNPKSHSSMIGICKN